jgi:hypothetical protein
MSKSRSGTPQTTVNVTEPNGTRRAFASIDELGELVFEAPDYYWKQGSGEVLIEYRKKGESSELTVLCRPSFGYMFLYVGSRAPDLMVSISGDDFRDKISLFTGGAFFKFPKAFFVTGPVAVQVIADFVSTGHCSKSIRWRRRIDISAFEPDEEPEGEPY